MRWSVLLLSACSVAPTTAPTASVELDEAARITCRDARSALGDCLATSDGALTSCIPDEGTNAWRVYETCCAGQDVRACEPATCFSVDPFDMGAVSAPDLDAMVATYNAGCGRGGSWCAMSTIAAFEIEDCTDADATFEDVIGATLAVDPNRYDWYWGTEVEVRSLSTHPFFGTTYSSAGPDVVDALRAHGKGTPLGWAAESEVPCPNCTEFIAKVILYWPLTGQVVALDGGWGYDS